jgi:hypothetical protein
MREVISSLRVWDAATRREIMLPQGTILTGCQLRRRANTGGEEGDAYTVEFEASGRKLVCPLFLFQPRTGPVDQSVIAASSF